MVKKSSRGFSLWIILTQTREAIYKARNNELDKYGITGRESAVLDAIYSLGEDVTPAKIARWVYREPHAITAILSRMQKKGFVKLSKDKIVKNLVRIAVTEKGKAAHIASLKRESINYIFKNMQEENLDQLQTNLVLIRDRALKLNGDVIPRRLP